MKGNALEECASLNGLSFITYPICSHLQVLLDGPRINESTIIFLWGFHTFLNFRVV